MPLKVGFNFLLFADALRLGQAPPYVGSRMVGGGPPPPKKREENKIIC